MSDEREGKKEELPSFESLYVGRFKIDKNLRVVDISDESARILNCTAADLISKEFTADFGPGKNLFEDFLEGKVQICECKMVDGTSCNMCFRIKESSNGKGFDVVFAKECPPFECHDGESLHYRELLVKSRDLENHALFLENLFANIGYDLKTPLGIILGYCELLIKSKASASGSVDTERALRTIYRNCAWIADIVEKLELLVSLVKRGKGENKIWLDIKMYLQETISRHTRTSFAKMTRIETDKIDDIKILASPTLISLLFDEIIKNAVQFSRKGKEIVINLIRTDEKVKLTVEIASLEEEIPPLNHFIERLFPYTYDPKKDDYSTKVECLGLGAVKYLAHLNDFSFEVKRKATGSEVMILERKV